MSLSGGSNTVGEVEVLAELLETCAVVAFFAEAAGDPLLREQMLSPSLRS